MKWEINFSSYQFIDKLSRGFYSEVYEGLKWKYEVDKDIALTINDKHIKEIRNLAKEYKIAISFGFFEKDEASIYSSNLFIDKNGEIIDLYHRVSKTWTIENASEKYKSGDDFHTYEFMGKTILVAICGDLWFDENIEKINDFKADLILWPLYIDYSIEVWERKAMEEYNQQVSQIHAPILMVNSYMKDGNGAVGGAYLFNNGKVLECLPLGEIGALSLSLKQNLQYLSLYQGHQELMQSFIHLLNRLK